LQITFADPLQSRRSFLQFRRGSRLYFITAWRGLRGSQNIEPPTPNIESKMAALTPFDGLLLAPFLEIPLAAEEPMRHVSHFHEGAPWFIHECEQS
jgi:hypothetical protein